MKPRFHLVSAFCVGLMLTPTLHAKKQAPVPDRWVEYQEKWIPLFSTKSFSPKKTVRPKYPPKEKSLEVSGHAIALVLVDTEGEVVDVIIQESQPVASFGVAAEASIRKWKFQILTIDDHPRNYLIHVPVVFNVSKEHR